jgi:hypothetical protein
LLLLSDRKMGGALSGFEPGSQPIKHLLCLANHRGGVCEKAEMSLLRAEEDVSRDRQIRRDGEFLVDDSDASCPGLMRRMEMHRLSIYGDLATVRGLRSGEDFHQGALARTVLTN